MLLSKLKIHIQMEQLSRLYQYLYTTMEMEYTQMMNSTAG